MSNTNKALGRFMKSSERLVKLADFQEFFDGLRDTLNAVIEGEATGDVQKSLTKKAQRLIEHFKGLPVHKQAELMGYIEAMSDEDFEEFV
jgi:hypothetical protein